MATEQKHFSEALLTDPPQKKINLVLKEGAVTGEKLGEGAVTWDKLSDDVKERFDKEAMENLTYWNVNKVIFSAFGF